MAGNEILNFLWFRWQTEQENNKYLHMTLSSTTLLSPSPSTLDAMHV